MEISLTPDVEERLNQLASQAGKGKEQVVQELIANYLEHDEWFRLEVAKGLASLDRGESVPHDEVGRRMERRLRSQ
jgi:RHH-type transcriptional regulator, rel operon repressor / antitoxin RelB